MPTLMIRNVDAAAEERLRLRAARHGRSMEANPRCILTEALEQSDDQALNLAETIHRRFALLGGVDLAIHPPVPIAEPPSFEP